MSCCSGVIAIAIYLLPWLLLMANCFSYLSSAQSLFVETRVLPKCANWLGHFSCRACVFTVKTIQNWSHMARLSSSRRCLSIEDYEHLRTKIYRKNALLKIILITLVTPNTTSVPYSLCKTCAQSY